MYGNYMYQSQLNYLIKVNFTHAYVSQDRLINDIFTIHKIYSFMPSLVKTDLVVLERIFKKLIINNVYSH